MLSVNVTKQLGEFRLEAAFESNSRITGLFGASGAGRSASCSINISDWCFHSAGPARRLPAA
jgi:ABC-type molybdate transport system ATPase subunit